MFGLGELFSLTGCLHFFACLRIQLVVQELKVAGIHQGSVIPLIWFDLHKLCAHVRFIIFGVLHVLIHFKMK